VITAFQRGKWYLQEAQRYADIAKCSRQIAIMAAPDAGFAEHPTSQLPNVDLVPLEPSDPVAQEWHLIILSSKYTAMVLCQELSDADYGVGGDQTLIWKGNFTGYGLLSRSW
jgi:DICT domain-containing protein